MPPCLHCLVAERFQILARQIEWSFILPWVTWSILSAPKSHCKGEAYYTFHPPSCVPRLWMGHPFNKWFLMVLCVPGTSLVWWALWCAVQLPFQAWRPVERAAGTSPQLSAYFGSHLSRRQPPHLGWPHLMTNLWGATKAWLPFSLRQSWRDILALECAME